MGRVASGRLGSARLGSGRVGSGRVGGKIVFATDDWFAVADNLLKGETPVWKEGEFTEYGKWMDGWETRRKRIPGHDWCIIQLGAPGMICGVDIDTSFFTGNYAPKVSLQSACLEDGAVELRRPPGNGTAASKEEFERIERLKSENWLELLPTSSLKPGYTATCHNYFQIDCRERVTHVRLNVYPDGGVARLRVYGQVVRDWSKTPANQFIDLVAMMNGGLCVGFSNAHFGHGRNLIRPGRASNMGDGWETARRLDRPARLTADDNGVLRVPGSEWAEFKLGRIGRIVKIEIDTNHFRGNYPDSCFIEACLASNPGSLRGSAPWWTLLPVQKLSAHRPHFYTVQGGRDVSHVRITMAPDGGISRMRLWGYATEAAPPSKI
ncbi:Allantoicase [Lamellibrachia satsuma]|nr:Allantoicase [Lamellibrachia satsuma]